MNTPNRLRSALSVNDTVWGGWIVASTVHGPQQFARAGYHYIGFDTQHGYLDDADVAVILHRLEAVPIATVVRLPSAAPAPIGRVLDAGADAVIIAMVETPEQAAAAVSATRYAPNGIRSYGPLSASLGTDPAQLQERAEVYVMIETAAALPAVPEICSVSGLAGVYIGPADLAISMGHGIGEIGTAPAVLDTITDIGAIANSAGLVAGIHAGSGALGRLMSDRGFRLITLASESQAMFRGAAEQLREAAGDRGTAAQTRGYN